MITRYPDTIVVTWNEEAALVDNVWIPGAAKTVESICRAEMNNGARKIPGADGTSIDFTMTVYMPKASIDIPENANFVLNGKISGIVKGAKNYQLGSVIWV